ncbi:MAG: hypothetical protein M1840_007597 [Geoglossum simile]|nr:MAG: hypothetical protein M1840_007597 [Geoglossum simile]
MSPNEGQGRPSSELLRICNPPMGTSKQDDALALLDSIRFSIIVDLSSGKLVDEPVDEPPSGLVDDPVEEPTNEPVDEPLSSLVDDPVDESTNEPVGKIALRSNAKTPRHLKFPLFSNLLSYLLLCFPFYAGRNTPEDLDGADPD